MCERAIAEDVPVRQICLDQRDFFDTERPLLI